MILFKKYNIMLILVVHSLEPSDNLWASKTHVLEQTDEASQPGRIDGLSAGSQINR